MLNKEDLLTFVVQSRKFIDSPDSQSWAIRDNYLNKLVANLDDQKVEIVTGIRRAGKTTLLLQVGQRILGKGVSQENVIYFKLDDERLGKIEARDLDELLDLHKTQYLPKGKIYLLLDEIQDVKDWEKWVKRIFDEPNDIKLLITGSSSQVNLSSAGKYLTGRNNLHTVYPFSFKEYLSWLGFDLEEDKEILFYSEKNSTDIKHHFEWYLKWGGFPEIIVTDKSDDQKEETLRRYFRDILERDIHAHYTRIRNPYALEKLAVYLVKNFGNRFSARSLSKVLGIAVETVQDYLEKLKQTFLFSELSLFSFKEKVVMSSQPKIYGIDHGLLQAVAASPTKNRGRLFENVFFTELLRRDLKAGFHKERAKEIDFIVSTPRDRVPVEITSQASVPKDKIFGFIKLRKKTGFPRGLMISGDHYHEDKEEGVDTVPLWLILLRDNLLETGPLTLKPSRILMPEKKSIERRNSLETAPVSQKRECKTGKPTSNEMQDTGILALVDIVDYTRQDKELGSKKAGLFLKHYYSETERIAEENGFDFVKSVGDVVLLFGKDERKLLELMLDLFVRDPVPDRYGFSCKIRMVAHFGFISFFLDSQGKKVDVVGSNAIINFRLEKRAKTWELLVTDSLFTGIQRHLDDYKIDSFREIWPEPLKGLEVMGNITVTYRLIPPREERGTGKLISDLYTKKREELFDSVKKIPVFGNLYRPIEMDKSFIDLSLEKEWKGSLGRGYFRKTPSYEKRHELLEDRSYEEATPDHFVKARDLFNHFNKGFIFGLPGAGKTTIMRHFVFQALTEDRERVVLLVNCRDLLMENFGEPEEGRQKTEGGEQRAEEGRRMMGGLRGFLFGLTVSFLFPGRLWEELLDEEKGEAETCAGDIYSAWQVKRAVVLIDALDEVPNREVKDLVLQISRVLMESISRPERGQGAGIENRFFLSSRPMEVTLVSRLEEPVFHVNPITMEHMRAMARRFYGKKTDVYTRFDNRIWQEPVVKKMGGTPLTAMLLLVYFESFGEFGMRYPTYDLIMKFILNRIWDKIKSGTFRESYQSIPWFFQEAEKDDFLEDRPEIKERYNVLSDLAFQSLFKSASGKAERTIPEMTLLSHFREWIDADSGDKVGVKARDWLDFFVKEHLLISTGFKEYLFIHSTIMEFLAARRLLAGMENKKEFRSMIKSMTNEEGKRILESLPMASGRDYETGCRILSILKPIFNKAEDDPTLPFRCLTETEAVEKKALENLSTELTQKAELKRINKGKNSKAWVYSTLAGFLLNKEEKELEEFRKKFDSLLPLCRETFVMDYLPGEWNKAGSDLVKARRDFLRTILHEEEFNKVTVKEKEEAEKPLKKEESLLTLDHPGSPHDKNFSYYRKYTGKTLTGFFGSPNLKHSGPIICVTLSPDGRILLSGSYDKTLKLWDMKSGREIRSFGGHENWVTSCALSSDGKILVSGSHDKTLKLWDRESGREIRTLEGHKGAVTSCALSSDGRTLLSGSYDHTLKLWDRESGREIRTFEGHKHWVNSCALSSDGKTLLSGSYDKTLKLWDVKSGREIRTLEGHVEGVTSCALSSDGKTLLSGSYDHTLKLWDRESGREIKTFEGHKDWVSSCALSSDGKTLLSGSSGYYALKLWDVESGREIKTFEGHKDGVTSCALSSDGKTLLSSGSSGSSLKLWDGESGKEVRRFEGHKGGVTSCVLSSDGKTLLSGSYDHTLKLWDMESGREIRTLEGHKGWVGSCALSFDGKTLLSGSSGYNTLKLWDVESSEEIRTFEGHKGVVASCAFSSDGRTLFSGSNDKTLKLWDVKSGREVRTFEGHQGGVSSCALSSDGKTLLSGSNDRTLKLWDVESGREIRIFEGHKSAVTSCALSPDGRTLLSGSDDKTLKLWDVESGREIRTFEGHQGAVTSCALSSNGKILLSGSSDHTLKLWNVDTGKEITTIKLLWIPGDLAFSPVDPCRLITANQNGTLTSFDLSDYLQ